MTVSIGAQAREFVYALLLGLCIGSVYFATHFFDRLRFLMDMVFSLAALVSASVFFLTVCGGLVRLYHLLGIFGGMLFVVYTGNLLLTRRKNGQKQKNSKKA